MDVYIIGIDTGGTYTDAVLMDYESKKILRQVKTFTTKENLNICIERCFDKLNFDKYEKVSAVCISTTLATNAIVEDTNCPTGTLLIGKKPDGNLPDSSYKMVEGLIDIKGDVRVPIDEKDIIQKINEFKEDGQGIEAVAVSGYASTRNPEFELCIKRKIQEELNLPVVCAHELTASLGYSERTVTAVLNAGLIPIITELVKAVKRVFKKYNVEATYMVVDGKGCLLYSEKVLERPISTILSGPASSMIGAKYLTDLRNGLIVDIGGTTTDVALVKDGRIAINENGAQVGSWQTRVEAASIHTFGLGGDTRIFLTSGADLILSSERVWPFAYMIQKFPHIFNEMQKYANGNSYADIEIIQAYRRARPEEMNEEEQIFLQMLQDGPHCRGYLKEKMKGKHLNKIIYKLHKNNWIIRGGFTPTDLMHVMGLYKEFDERGSRLALSYFAKRTNRTPEDTIQVLAEMITDKFISCCRKVYRDKDRAKIVCIGAPAKSWMNMMDGRLNADIMVPEYAEAANAIGAAVGSISPSVDILVRPDNSKGVFYAYTQEKREIFGSLEEAKDYAIRIACEQVKKIAKESRSKDYEISENVEDVFCEDSTGEQVYVETKIKVIAVGIPDLYSNNESSN